MPVSMRRSVLLWAFLMAWWGSAVAQPPAGDIKPGFVAGEYVGVLNGALHLRLHIQVDASGAMSGTLDSLDQGAIGLACAEFHLSGNSLSFTVPVVRGSWKGTISGDGNTLAGTWDQGQAIPLIFHRDTFVAGAKPSAIDGIWLGSLKAGGSELRIQVLVKSDREGVEYCTLDSLDQHAMGLECANLKFSGDRFAFDVPAVHGHYEGKLSADGKTLAGTWTQGAPVPLDFTRQEKAIAAATIAPPVYEAAEAPASGDEIERVMKRDLAEALAGGELAPSTGLGVSIGVVVQGVRRVFSLGTAQPDSLFEIGSVTKTFTGLILAQMVEQGKVKFDDPVRTLLPEGTVAKPAGAEITLLDLATQHSGLPRMPDNFSPADPANPYADYTPAKLYAFIAKHGVGKTAEPPPYQYSNLGFGLLGQALAVHAGMSYPQLLKKEVTGPLRLNDTTVELSASQRARVLQAHDAEHRPSHAWDLDGMAGAGAIRSTAVDMLTYLEANLHPEALKLDPKLPEAKTLPAALTVSHHLYADAFGGQKIALAWHYVPETGTYWHNGATGGYSSYAFFNPKADFAGVVLLNETIGQAGSYADRIGEHIEERLAGKPAIAVGK